jgi:DNA modification methylase
MAKTIDDLIESRKSRDTIKRLFGGVMPDSVLKHNRTDLSMDTQAESRSYSKTGNDAGFEGQIGHAFVVSGRGGRTTALSRFPQNIGRILVNLYSKRGDTVVDPFAGHNSRMEFCWRLERHYVGCDVSRVFMAANRQIRETLLHSREHDFFPTMNKATITLHECDSREMPVKSGLGDFTITSPPYWNIEDYGDETGQLGKNDDYREFLRQLERVASENFRCLKSGSFCVWCVNDFRWQGKFYNYHGHTIDLMRSAGFKQFDIAIIDLGVPPRAAFAAELIRTKILPKRHEYALVFVKP